MATLNGSTLTVDCVETIPSAQEDTIPSAQEVGWITEPNLTNTVDDTTNTFSSYTWSVTGLSAGGQKYIGIWYPQDLDQTNLLHGYATNVDHLYRGRLQNPPGQHQDLTSDVSQASTLPQYSMLYGIKLPS